MNADERRDRIVCSVPLRAGTVATRSSGAGTVPSKVQCVEVTPSAIVAVISVVSISSLLPIPKPAVGGRR